MKNILFYYPSRTVGGTQCLYSRCANYLALHSSYKVFYVDYFDGFARNNLLYKEVNIIEKTSSPVLAPDNTVCIIQLNFLDSVSSKICMTRNSRFIFWAITPGSISNKTKKRGISILTSKERLLIGSILKELSEMNNIVYMDYENYIDNANCFRFQLANPHYVPVTIDDRFMKSEFIYQENIHFNVLRFAWLGRLDTDKLPTLITFMNELELVKGIPIGLSIIGTGNCVERIKKISKKYKYPISFAGCKIDEDLSRYIDENVDVGIGMGISALEFTKRGKPAILRGFMKRPHKGGVLDNYIFVSQMHKYTPGTPCVDVEGQSTFQQKVNEIIEEYNKIAYECYYYTITNHNPKNTCELLLESIEKNQKYDNERAISLIDRCVKTFARINKRSLRISNFIRFLKNEL